MFRAYRYIASYRCMLSLPPNLFTWQSVRMLQDKLDKLTSENNQLRVHTPKMSITKLCNFTSWRFLLPFPSSPTVAPFLLFLPPSSPLPLSLPHQSEANKLRQRANLSSSAASAPLKTTTSGTPAAQPQSSLHIVAIMLILVALILGYLVGKWL